MVDTIRSSSPPELLLTTARDSLQSHRKRRYELEGHRQELPKERDKLYTQLAPLVSAISEFEKAADDLVEK
eukprot:11485348-Prorocentrum_lima.AAC.1